MSFGIEHFRRLRPHNMGTLVWQLNDCWPVQSWAWVDYACAPRQLGMQQSVSMRHCWFRRSMATGQLTVHLVNDAVDAVDGELVVRVIDAKGTACFEHRADETADARQ